MQAIAPIAPTRRFKSPAEMAAALGTSRYPSRGVTCADWKPASLLEVQS